MWAQNATATPSVIPASLTARRRSSVRSRYENRSSGVTVIDDVLALHEVLRSAGRSNVKTLPRPGSLSARI